MQSDKTVTDESSQQGTKGTECFKCRDYGHFAYQCPARSLFIDKGHDDDEHGIDDVYDPQGDFCDAEEDLREVGTHLHIIMCLHVASKDDDWRRSSVFHTYVTYEGKNFKVMIDGDSCVNIISKSTVEKMGLNVELHPQPYNVTWVDKNFHSIIQHCLVPI